MDYAEDRERSEEVLRVALALVGRQAAALNPHSYTIFYEHCGGLNPSLSRVLETRLAANSPLTDEDVRRLYTEHIVGRDLQQREVSLRDVLCP
jgi:diguanylate cyclase